MSKILIITGILPVSAIEYKKTENDILLVTEDEIKSRYQNVSFKYIFTFPYANKILSKISLKWESYYKLKKQETFELKGRNLFLFPVFLLPKKVFFRNVLTRLSIFLHRKRIEKLIKDFNPTVLHAQDADTGAYIARLLSEKYGIPYVVTLRGLNRVIDKDVKINLVNAKSLIAISSRQITDGEKLVKKKITFIPHGVSDYFYNNKLDKKITEPVRLITVSRLLKLKNIDLVIKSLSTLKTDFVFDIYGDGAERESLLQLIKQLNLQDKVRLKGFVNNYELPYIFLKYDLFIMTSYPETLGRVYFEAMAGGLPVIASKRTGIDGLIEEGTEGFLLDTFDKDKFTKDLNQIISDFCTSNVSYEVMSKNAKVFAEQYSWDNIVPKYIELYRTN